MERGSTLFLKIVVILMGIPVLALCIFGLPGMAARDAAAHPETAYLQYPFLIAAYITITPFFFALYQTFKLLQYIDQNNAFSELSVKALKYIKYCGIIISTLVLTGEIVVIILTAGAGEDITGVIGLGFILIFGSLVIAVFAAVLQRLLQEAIDIKAENDLII
ncbi:hypothetical protein BHU72_10785 [Desulfuribacillus stibiiarsenatis]|uniref:DUF2975 domain-containing protein n=1 Tax=Desulfuribacillus stibiiarsenatis TaxID=1390249 RepID=A0A1E5L2A8_9FIRM|nr:DUF2975 domain-containing protein [Desulfuribacillus stibiiarsenatis]OEH84292.1 hypothetical protein BHU72_10785 [Desulfuribacillus stibiiarsenatis]